MVGTEIAVRQMQETQRLFADVVRGLDREHVLEALVSRDRKHRWRPAADGSKADLSAHEVLLALATMCRGIGRAQIAAIQGSQHRNLLPSTIDVATLEAMGSQNALEVVEPLEPDILGEYFVLGALRDFLAPNGRSEAFLGLAYELGEMQAAVFTLRVMQDFPERFEANNGLCGGAAGGEFSAILYARICINACAAMGQSRRLVTCRRNAVPLGRPSAHVRSK